MNKQNFLAALAGLSLLVFAATSSFAGGHGGWSGGHGGWSGGHGGWNGGHGHWGGGGWHGYNHGYWYHNHWYGGFYPGVFFYPFDYGYGYYPYGYGYYPGYYDNGYSGSDYRQASAQIQQALAQMGYYSGPIDGQIGPSTLVAVRQFQHDRGLVVTGQLDGPTLQALGH